MIRLKNRDKGSAVVEFALLVGLLLIFIAGIVEFGFLWFGSNYIANAAREGARAAAKVDGGLTYDVDRREAAAIQAATTYLRANTLIGNLIDTEPDFLDIDYTRDPEKSVNVDIDDDGDLDSMIMAEVTVTIQSHMIWEPMLWPLLSALIPGVNFDTNKLRQISQTASFATSEVTVNE